MASDRSGSTDLVIDTTGRGPWAPNWLELLGYAWPEQEEVRIDYALGDPLTVTRLTSSRLRPLKPGRPCEGP